MRMMMHKVVFLGVFSFLIFTVSPLAHSDTPQKSLDVFYAQYQSLLADVVHEGVKNDLPLNLVDYRALRSDPRLDRLMQFLAEFDYQSLSTRSDRIAYFLNAYNIMALNMVVDNWPIESLRGLGNMFRPVWTHGAGALNHENITLRKLEHDILRKQSEPRIHFALNCASVSCPDLRPEPYQGDRLDAQLDDQTYRFFAQQGKGAQRIDGQLYVSPLMDWFDEDFDEQGGVADFLMRYLSKSQLGSSNAKLEVAGFLDYDWDINAHLNLIGRRRAKQK